MRLSTLWFLLFGLNCLAQAPASTGQAEGSPYLILISLDGFRHDYVELLQPPRLSAAIEGGVRTEGLIPCYPSKTFPNHYSIATGMYPENHGLVNNSFYDPSRGEKYTTGNREAVQDGTWYGGTPLWVNAERAGMISASYFFVGSEADIQGVRPSYYYLYDQSVTHEQRVDQVVDWLTLPEGQRPHFITLYFPDMDDAGHFYSPAPDSLRAPLMKLDATLGNLFDRVAELDLPVNYIVVSDHGMTTILRENMLNYDALLSEIETVEMAANGSLLHLYFSDEEAKKKALDQLEDKEGHFQAYSREDFPYYRENLGQERVGDVLIAADFGYYFVNSRAWNFFQRSDRNSKGEHGFPPKNPDMHGIFYAFGPAFREGLTIPAFENIHIYPLVCEILGLDTPEEVDGRLEVLQPILK
ncbi:MAG: alkaline phosphatase family protein [Saprospiraceae bacterium]|nr:alkaline phosphatase family protein [Saprospiraceae bacterium]